MITIKSYNYVRRKTIYLCLAHMSKTGEEQKYVKEAFDTNWVVPMGPNVNAFEEDLRKFVTGKPTTNREQSSSLEQSCNREQRPSLLGLCREQPIEKDT